MGEAKCPMLVKKPYHEYGAVRGVKDIRAINCHIREQIKTEATTRAMINDLLRRSLYLYILTFAPRWKEAFRGKIRQMRKAAKEERKRIRELQRIIEEEITKLQKEGKLPK